MAKIPRIAEDRIANELYEAALQGSRPKRKYLGMSQIGKPCARELWYGFRGFTPVPLEGRIKMLFRLGYRIEEEIIYHLTLAGYRVEAAQKAFIAHHGYFRGHCDGIIHGVTSQPHILECKSANKKKFDLFKKKGIREVYPVYYAQCQCYMGYSGLERALVVVQCKDNSEIYTERIYFNRFDFEALHNRAGSIIFASTPPDQRFSKDSFECEYCSQRISCWYPEEAIMTDGHCGTCYYFDWKGLTSICRHPDHPFSIHQWGIGCPDWVDMFQKALPGKPFPYKSRIPLDELNLELRP